MVKVEGLKGYRANSNDDVCEAVKLPGASVKEVAKAIRDEIKAAVKSGELPKATYSVRMEHHNSIRVQVSNLGFDTLDPDCFSLVGKWLEVERAMRADDERPYERRCSVLSDKAYDVSVKLNAMVNAYHWDKSDIMTDYFNSRFYKHVEVEADGEREALRERLLAVAEKGAVNS